MSIKCLVAGLLLISIAVSQKVNAAGEWAGYINDKSLSGEVYGYLSSVSNAQPASKLRIVCRSDGSFTLYFDERYITENAPAIKIKVDRLPAIFVPLKRVDNNIAMSNRDPEFWRLTAQMSAGALLRIDYGTRVLHEYSLSGFTSAFLSHCGWSGEATRFQQYVNLYR